MTEKTVIKSGKTVKFEFTPGEIRLIAYWRESCHLYNEFCPLHCFEEGVNFCNKLAEKMAETVEKNLKESK